MFTLNNDKDQRKNSSSLSLSVNEPLTDFVVTFRSKAMYKDTSLILQVAMFTRFHDMFGARGSYLNFLVKFSSVDAQVLRGPSHLVEITE